MPNELLFPMPHVYVSDALGGTAEASILNATNLRSSVTGGQMTIASQQVPVNDLRNNFFTWRYNRRHLRINDTCLLYTSPSPRD